MFSENSDQKKMSLFDKIKKLLSLGNNFDSDNNLKMQEIYATEKEFTMLANGLRFHLRPAELSDSRRPPVDKTFVSYPDDTNQYKYKIENGQLKVRPIPGNEPGEICIPTITDPINLKVLHETNVSENVMFTIDANDDQVSLLLKEQYDFPPLGGRMYRAQTNHSSMTHGKPVMAAGYMKFSESGKLLKIELNSGHYAPNDETANKLIEWAKRHKAFNPLEVELLNHSGYRIVTKEMIKQDAKLKNEQEHLNQISGSVNDYTQRKEILGTAYSHLVLEVVTDQFKQRKYLTDSHDALDRVFVIEPEEVFKWVDSNIGLKAKEVEMRNQMTRGGRKPHYSKEMNLGIFAKNPIMPANLVSESSQTTVQTNPNEAYHVRGGYLGNQNHPKINTRLVDPIILYSVNESVSEAYQPASTKKVSPTAVRKM